MEELREEKIAPFELMTHLRQAWVSEFSDYSVRATLIPNIQNRNETGQE